jgi:hypothetical protein
MEPQYDVETWARETALGRRIFNHRFRMFGSELAGWSLVKSVIMHRDGELLEMTHLWRNDAAPERELVSVNVAELPDWRRAQRHLLSMLDHSMRGELPRATGPLRELGDVTFAARAPESDVAAAVLFARSNIAVAVNSAGSATVDVSRFALVVDRMLSAIAPDADGLVPRPTSRAVAMLAKEATGELPLDLDLGKADGAWLKVVAPDGELRRHEDTLLYSAADPGAKTLQVFVFEPQPSVERGPSGAGRIWLIALIAAILLALLYLVAGGSLAGS